MSEAADRHDLGVPRNFAIPTNEEDQQCIRTHDRRRLRALALSTLLVAGCSGNDSSGNDASGDTALALSVVTLSVVTLSSPARP